MKTGSRRSFSVAALSLALGATLTACGSQSEEAEPTVTREDVEGAPPTRTATLPPGETPEVASPAAGTPVETPEAAGSPTAGNGGATALTVDMIDLQFVPNMLTIPADTDVTITVINKGVLPHNFSVTDQPIDSGEVSPGQSADVVVNLPAGTYEIYCNIPGHKEAGMVGTLTVS